MLSQVSEKYREILDLLGVHIIGLPGHLENIGQREIKKIEIKVSERRMYFHSSTSEKGDLILGSAPVYFGYNAVNGLEGKSLPSSTTKIKKILDAGEGNHFIDKNGYSFGQYYIELDGGPGFIIGADPKDEIIKSDDKSVSILRATSGSLRMFSKDLETLAKYLQKTSTSNISIEFNNE
jgi:hypothetical protein